MATSNSDKQSNSERGFAKMPKEEVKRNAKKGGESQGKENNPGNFANRPKEEVQRAGSEGGSQ